MKTMDVRLVWGTVVCALALLAVGTQAATEAQARGTAEPNPVLVLETSKGTIEIELFPREAPKTVEHIMALVKRNFYRGQRFHRAEKTVVQIGDPASRDMTRQAWWGRTNTGEPIGVAEFSKRATHVRGAVGMAHAGEAKYATTQFYILKQAVPEFDGKYTVFGRVRSGLAVVDALQVADILKAATIK